VSKAKQFIPTPPFVAARWHGGKQTPKAIVMHGTVSPCERGGARNIANFFAHEDGKTSAHYVVDPGEVVQCVGDHTVAYHCGYNTGSIGVELCDPETGPASRWHDKNHDAMLDQAADLVAHLCLAYGIEATHVTVPTLKAKGPHGIYSHNQSRLAFGHTTHTDPRGFPWPDFMRRVHKAIDALQAPKPKPAPKPEPTLPDPGRDRPYHEQQALDEARTVADNAAKAGHKPRASKWRAIVNAILGKR
jgi:N-acetylmuramoyl-L-alanine amidase CwlA